MRWNGISRDLAGTPHELRAAMIGEHVGGYEIRDVLGHGTQGIVYAAHHASLGRDVAIKVFLPQLARDPERVHRFFDEARAIATLRHPGVVKVHDWGHDDRGRVFVAMERLCGETLYERLRRGPLSFGEAVTITRQLALALAAAHEHADEDGHAAPIVHRDLKPENVFLVDEDDRVRVVLVDFGLASLANATVTWSGAGAFGTPPYMSPEQWRGDVDIDRRTDLYALGCVLYEMITGTPPFGFGSVGELAKAHCEVEALGLADCAPDVPAALDTLVRGLLAKEAASRPASCRDVIAALDEIAIAEPRHERRPPRTIVAGRGMRRTWPRRAWRSLLALPPWTAAGVMFAAGTILLGTSTVAGVGDSYLASPNWSFAFVVVVPLIVSFMLRVVQGLDAAARDMVSRGMIEPREDVAPTLERFGGWQVGLALALVVAAVVVSIGEWWQRFRYAPIPGVWWSESAVVGVLGAILQGVFIALILGFVAHLLSWAQMIYGWTSARSGVRLRTDRLTREPRGGFHVLEEPLLFALVVSMMVQLVLYLSNVQHIAEINRIAFLDAASPFGGVFDNGPGHYPSGVPLIASALVAGFSIAALLIVRRAITASAGGEPRPVWPVAAIGPGEAAGVLVATVFAIAFYRLGGFVFLAIALFALVRVRRD